jgi:hypothetical protein
MTKTSCRTTSRTTCPGQLPNFFSRVWCYEQHFQRVSAIFVEKMGVFLEKQCCDQFYNKIAVFLV